MNTPLSHPELASYARELRIDVLEMLHRAGSGHIGGAFGMAEIFTVLYTHFLQIDPYHPASPDRDYCLLSNGHICPIWYATLAKRGFFEKEHLWTLRTMGSLLQGHPKLSTPGVENASGPLGHGLSQAIGIALALDKKSHEEPALPHRQRVVCCMSDGEHQEGQIWEAIMSAKKWNLSRLIGIVDVNGLQIEGSTDEVMPLGSLGQKYHAFGWNVREIDGHDFAAIIEALEWADACEGPSVILAHTILGKGVSFMENNWKYHDWPAKAGDYEAALEELKMSQIKISMSMPMEG